MNARKMNEAYNTGSRWDAMDVSERQTTIKIVVSSAMLLRGQGRMDIGTLETIVEKIDYYILSEYPGLRDKEFEYLLNLGISGELGQDTYVSGAMIMKWVRQFYHNPERLALVDAEDKREQDKNKPTPQAIAQKNVDALNEARRRSFEFYKENGTIFGEKRNEKGKIVARGFNLPQWAAQVYNHFKALGEIPEPSTERLKKAAELAVQNVEDANAKLKLPAECLICSKFDWRDSILLEMYYEDLITQKL